MATLRFLLSNNITTCGNESVACRAPIKDDINVKNSCSIFSMWSQSFDLLQVVYRKTGHSTKFDFCAYYFVTLLNKIWLVDQKQYQRCSITQYEHSFMQVHPPDGTKMMPFINVLYWHITYADIIKDFNLATEGGDVLLASPSEWSCP